jgi:hypothetical protein
MARDMDVVEQRGPASVAHRRTIGREARERVARGGLAACPDGPVDPVALLRGQDADRVPELLPIRYERMAASPFAYYRGSAVVMAADLATGPTTGLRAQLCGDAHLSNFGVFATPERRLVFDVNFFD